MKIENNSKAIEELNDACGTIEDTFGEYDEISGAMERINAVIDFLYEQEQNYLDLKFDLVQLISNETLRYLETAGNCELDYSEIESEISGEIDKIIHKMKG